MMQKHTKKLNQQSPVRTAHICVHIIVHDTGAHVTAALLFLWFMYNLPTAGIVLLL